MPDEYHDLISLFMNTLIRFKKVLVRTNRLASIARSLQLKSPIKRKNKYIVLGDDDVDARELLRRARKLVIHVLLGLPSLSSSL